MATTAASIRKYHRFFDMRNVKRVLDYGAGKLRNADFLTEQGFEVYAADVPEQVRRILESDRAKRLAGVLPVELLDRTHLNVDLVLSTYVLNIIPDGTEKSRYLRNIALNLRTDGYLLVEAACRRTGTTCDQACSFHMKCGSCVKTYSHDELDRLVAPYGFRRICHYYRNRAVAVIYQLQNG